VREGGGTSGGGKKEDGWGAMGHVRGDKSRGTKAKNEWLNGCGLLWSGKQYTVD